MRSFFLSVFVYFLFLVHTWAQVAFDWAGSFSGGSNYEFVSSSVVDKDGNLYVVGSFPAGVDFDPSSSIYTLAPVGYNVFITKLDSSGNLVWAKQVGGGMDDRGYRIFITHHNELLVTGLFKDTADFDPGPATAHLVAFKGPTINLFPDIFLLKLDLDGNYIWAKGMGGSWNDSGYGIAEDSKGNIYLCGTFQFIADFDPGPVIANLTGTGPLDAFIVKLDSTGNYIWAKRVGGTGEVRAHKVTVDEYDGVYVGGDFTGTCDFDPDTSVYNKTGNFTQFLMKLDTNGTFKWVRSFFHDYVGSSIFIDRKGNSYIPGRFNGTADFDPGPGTYNLTGNWDAFLLKLDSGGNFNWVFQREGGLVGAKPVFVNSVGEIYMGGTFEDSVDFDSGPGEEKLYSQGGRDVFITKYTSTGNLVWAKSFGGVNYESIHDLVVFPDEDIYSVGNFTGTTDFNPDLGVYSITSTTTDIYVLKLQKCGIRFGVKNITACGSYEQYGKIYSTSGTYVDTISYATDCDSIITLNLTVHPENDSTVIEKVTCDSFLWYGNMYDQSGVYTKVLENSFGCDSVLILDILVNKSDSGYYAFSSCGPVQFGEKIYTETGYFSDTLTNIAGCDSILYLTVQIDTINLSISQSMNELVSDETGAGVVYQWMDCDNSYSPVSGAVSRTFTPVKNGSYAVSITKNPCSDTSDCYDVHTIGILETEGREILITPNPTTGKLSIDLGKTYNDVELILFDLRGVILQTWNFSGERILEVSIEEMEGIYLLGLYADNENKYFKVIRK